ncbi:hypothetical protein MNBD_CHLOROFLEXI01-3445 [hydrothermal vent metagenome]|uniref:Response regulatory domain-containing protein n=1 Tax=hydrothermal vent metagenome TaxID=652676 RepID=A0A3B0UX83_9ZZZZ
MSVIGIVDDRDDVRAIMLDNVRLALPDGWEAIDISPWNSLDNYPSWISQEEIVALIIDERLNEVANASGAVDYEGHDLVDYMRQHMPEFPIFVVTSYKEDALELGERFKDVEDIIERNQFYERSSDYIPRIIRAGQRYLQTFERELAELGDFAKKSAIGEDSSTEEHERAKAIQTKIETAFPIENIASRGELLSQMEQLIAELETLKTDIEQQAKR